MNRHKESISPITFNRLTIGTAQFGEKYGINNTTGAVDEKSAMQILKCARSSGISHADTAMSYKNSEVILGRVGVVGWNVVTKLPRLDPNISEIEYWVIQSVNQSLKSLNLQSLYGLLLHNSGDLMGSQGEKIFQSLLNLKNAGLVKKIGVSIYEPGEISPIISKYKIDLIQVPFNLLDRRLLSGGWLSRLNGEGIEIHARSIFLQGLLLMNAKSRPTYFDPWKYIFLKYQNWLKDNDCSAISACLQFALAQKEIDQVIVGIESLDQLTEIVECLKEQPIKSFFDISEVDLFLVNPTMWKLV